MPVAQHQGECHGGRLHRGPSQGAQQLRQARPGLGAHAQDDDEGDEADVEDHLGRGRAEGGAWAEGV